MSALPTHRGEMPHGGSIISQGLSMADEHPKRVTDPAARRTKKAFDMFASSAIGLEMGVSVIVGLLFGYWLDGKLGTAPWLMIVFVALGFAAGVRALLSGVKRADAAATRDEEDRGGGK